LIFWNYDGINRWLGGVVKESHEPAGLLDLFGNADALNAALAICRADPPDKEVQLRDLFMRTLESGSGAQFILPFRVEARGSDRTSHYLIHCTCHSLGFRIMKDVMGTASTSDEVGSFEFLSAADTKSLFAPRIDRARDEILNYLATVGPTPVSVFTKQWISRRKDFFRRSDYRQILLDLETANAIQVWDKTNSTPNPRAKRGNHLGAPKLPEGCFIRLST
jgi:hypothetical protein